MALEANAKKTEHCGAKNMAHDKPAKRAELKKAARKLRRAAEKRELRNIDDAIRPS